MRAGLAKGGGGVVSFLCRPTLTNHRRRQSRSEAKKCCFRLLLQPVPDGEVVLTKACEQSHLYLHVRQDLLHEDQQGPSGVEHSIEVEQHTHVIPEGAVKGWVTGQLAYQLREII